MTREKLLNDAYGALARAKKAVILVQASEPASRPVELTEVNLARLDRALAECADAVLSINAAKEMP